MTNKKRPQKRPLRTNVNQALAHAALDEVTARVEAMKLERPYIDVDPQRLTDMAELLRARANQWDRVASTYENDTHVHPHLRWAFSCAAGLDRLTAEMLDDEVNRGG